MAKESPAPKLTVKSDLIAGFVNVFGILAAYGIVIGFMVWFLNTFNDLNLLEIFGESIHEIIGLLPPDIAVFLTDITSDHVLGIVFVAAIYALYLEHFQLKLYRRRFTLKRGYFWIEPISIDVEDIEEVFTRPYPFLSTTKELCLMTLDDETIRIPYVRDADRIKVILIETTKIRLSEAD